jgi:hypothetical protein
VVVPTVEEEMERLEKTLEEVRRQYPVHTASGENVAESSEAGDSGDDTE